MSGLEERPLYLDDAAEILENYADFIRHSVKADDLDMHPYLPHLDEVASKIRAEAARVEAMDLALNRIAALINLPAWLDKRAGQSKSRWAARLYRIIADDLRARLHEEDKA